MAVTVTIRFFAIAREWAGRASEEVDLDPGSTTDQVWDHLISREPRFASWRGRWRLAVNDEYVAGRVALQTGDEIAVIPPVSGG
jgi:molybdopterin converting factor subunit 1